MNETILVVDDDTDLRETIVEILDDQGYSVAAAASAESALEAMAGQPARVVLVDNMMPGMSGMTLIPLLKQQYPATKVIMITAFSTVENAVTAMRSGADDYLAKPFKREELLVAIRRVLEIVKFEQREGEPLMDEALSSLANPLRRQILIMLAQAGTMRFMDITRSLGIQDHTKVNFHLRNLKNARLIGQDREKCYILTPQGEKMLAGLQLLAKKISP
jgi:DNA-binding NtrC family response regulator